MTSERHLLNVDIDIDVTFINATGAGITNAVGVITIRRQSDDFYWNGSIFAATVVQNAMTEIDETNSPGVWRFTFTPTANDVYEVVSLDTSGNSVLPRFDGQIIVDSVLADNKLARQALINRLVLSNAATDNLILFDDDGTTELKKWTVKDKDSNTISVDALQPMDRSDPTL